MKLLNLFTATGNAGVSSTLNCKASNTIKRFFECTLKTVFITISIVLLGLTSTANAAAPSVQQQLETLTRQLEQQQKMMQQQQSLIEKMQRQLDEQKIAEEKMHQKGLEEEQKIHVRGEEIDKHIVTDEQKEHTKGQEIDKHIATDEQKVHAKGQRIDKHIATDEKKVHAKGQELEQKTAKAEGDATQALKEVDVLAKATGVDLSREMFRYSGKGTTIKVPEAKTALTIGGFIRASFIHDFNAIDSPYKFVTKDIVVNGQPSGVPNKRTTFTANTSRLFFSTATPFEIGQLTTFFSFDLAGNTTSASPDFRLRQAWGQLDDFVFGGNLRVGQAWSTWDDVDVLPETMDFEGPNGSQQNRQALVRWSRDYAKAYLFEIALENPGYEITDGSTSTGMPDTIVALSWHGDDWGHLRSAFLARHLRGDGQDKNGVYHSDATFGWGLQVSGDIKTPLLHKKDNIKFQLVYGAGTGNYNNDGYDDALLSTSGDLRTINAFQGFGAYQHWWTDTIRSNAVFGWVDMDNNSDLTADDLDRTFYTSGNIVWSPYKQVDIGLEYLWGQRRNVNHDIGSANRIQATTHFSF